MDNKNKEHTLRRFLGARFLFAGIVILLLAFGLGVQSRIYFGGLRPALSESDKIIAVAGFDDVHKEDNPIVMLSGQVTRRGYYAVSPDVTMRELLEFAGLTADSDISEFDMAHKPILGDEYYVRNGADPLDITPWLNNKSLPIDDSETKTEILINLNTATIEELQSLPKIGEIKAQAIIDYRIEHKGFRSKEEIMAVNGIGQKIYEELMDKITV